MGFNIAKKFVEDNQKSIIQMVQFAKQILTMKVGEKMNVHAPDTEDMVFKRIK